MHRLIMATGILSMVTLAAAGLGLAWFSVSQPEHAGFLRDYLVHLDANEQGQVREFLVASASRGKITDEALHDYLLDHELQARLEALGPRADTLLVPDTGAIDQEFEATHAMIDRMASRAQAYDAIRAETDRLRQEAQAEHEKAQRVLEEWNEKARSSRLNQLVEDLNRTREPETLLPQLAYLPLSDLYWVLMQTKHAENRAIIFAELPEETQRALASVGTNPAGIAR